MLYFWLHTHSTYIGSVFYRGGIAFSFHSANFTHSAIGAGPRAPVTYAIGEVVGVFYHGGHMLLGCFWYMVHLVSNGHLVLFYFVFVCFVVGCRLSWGDIRNTVTIAHSLWGGLPHILELGRGKSASDSVIL